MILRTMHSPVGDAPPLTAILFPLVCVATVFGLITGVAVTGIVLPVVVQAVVPAVMHLVTGA